MNKGSTGRRRGAKKKKKESCIYTLVAHSPHRLQQLDFPQSVRRSITCADKRHKRGMTDGRFSFTGQQQNGVKPKGGEEAVEREKGGKRWCLAHTLVLTDYCFFFS